ncbi:hypothetical protein J4468_01100 [Candidatus Woesearchaeota archaeon]|nr:hypothetical protein [Candidatus Woesearchaeota archaeon]
MEEKISYQCVGCGYNFRRNRFESVCPFCGKKGTVQKVRPMNAIVDEIE